MKVNKLLKPAEADGVESGDGSVSPTESGLSKQVDLDIEDDSNDVENDFADEYSEFANEFLADDGVLSDEDEETAEGLQDEPEVPEVPEEEAESESRDEETQDEDETSTEEESQDSSDEEKDAEEETQDEPDEQVTLEELLDRQSKARETARQRIIESIKYTEDQVKRLREEPETVLPELAADLFLDMHAAVLASVQQQLPQLLQVAEVQRTQQQQATDAFTAAWPALDLKKKEHFDVVSRTGTMYRQLNPKATQEQFIREVGAQAMIALKIPLSAEMGLIEPESEPETPPHVPVQPASASRPSPNAPLNEFEALAEEFLEEDRR